MRDSQNPYIHFNPQNKQNKIKKHPQKIFNNISGVKIRSKESRQHNRNKTVPWSEYHQSFSVSPLSKLCILFLFSFFFKDNNRNVNKGRENKSSTKKVLRSIDKLRVSETREMAEQEGVGGNEMNWTLHFFGFSCHCRTFFWSSSGFTTLHEHSRRHYTPPGCISVIFFVRLAFFLFLHFPLFSFPGIQSTFSKGKTWPNASGGCCAHVHRLHP